jgi:quaternary ammonium compound-resistance protein SugE
VAWLYLGLAGLFEIGWPVGFKLSQQPGLKAWGIGGAGSFVVGVLFFGDASSLPRWFGLAMILGGFVLLQLGH